MSTIMDQAASVLPLLDLTAIVFGACVGSFLNVLILRLPCRESLLRPGSRCPACGHHIRPWENIPVLSWLILRARCSQCRIRISVRYPLIEAFTALLFFFLWRRFWAEALPWPGLPATFFLAGLVVAAGVIDFEHRIIPDNLTAIGVTVAVILALFWPSARVELLMVDSGGVFGMAGAGDEWLKDMIENPWLQARAIAGKGLGLGMVSGAVPLLLIRWVGGRLWGRLRQRPRPGDVADLKMTPSTIEIDGREINQSSMKAGGAGKEIVFRIVSLYLELENGTVVFDRDQAGPEKEEATFLRVSDGRLLIGDCYFPRSQIGRLSGTVSEWSIPREVLGLGDIKLLTTIGAFIGAGPILAVIFLASLLGTVGGVLLLALNKLRGDCSLSFGPFVGIGTLIWLLAGERIIGFLRFF